MNLHSVLNLTNQCNICCHFLPRLHYKDQSEQKFSTITQNVDFEITLKRKNVRLILSS